MFSFRKKQQYFAFITVSLLLAFVILSYFCLAPTQADAQALSKGESKPIPSWQKPDSLKHGEEQISAMIRDRPDMAKYVNRGDAVWKWTVNQFAGEHTGVKIYWSNQSPGKYEGLCVFPWKSNGGSIRVKKAYTGTDSSVGEWQWCTAVFELIKMRTYMQSSYLQNEYHTTNMSEEDWTNKHTKLEFQALVSLREFYKNTWKVHSRMMNVPVHPCLWEMCSPEGFEEWKNSPVGKRYMDGWKSRYPG